MHESLINRLSKLLRLPYIEFEPMILVSPVRPHNRTAAYGLDYLRRE